MDRVEELENWISALRSGKYQQGHKSLVNYIGNHCCLGVLVAESEDYRLVEREYKDAELKMQVLYGNAFPPLPINKRLGLHSNLKDVIEDRRKEFIDWLVKLNNPKLQIEEMENKPINVIVSIFFNDEAGLNFNQIAEFLEKFHLPYLRSLDE